MPIDLDVAGRPRERWVALEGELSGVELLLRYSSPREQEVFRHRLLRRGIIRHDAPGIDIMDGKLDAFCVAFAEQYVLDWRGDIKPEGTPYNAAKLGAVIGDSMNLMNFLTREVNEAAAFLGTNGSGPTQS